MLRLAFHGVEFPCIALLVLSCLLPLFASQVVRALFGSCSGLVRVLFASFRTRGEEGTKETRTKHEGGMCLVLKKLYTFPIITECALQLLLIVL
ncbi:MAG TPA: hypothetical protein VFQ73_05690, partial [Flavisolibacter sp.]|nr:hypothetical protein [Flavisolibacter sp.]